MIKRLIKAILSYTIIFVVCMILTVIAAPFILYYSLTGEYCECNQGSLTY